MIARPCTRWAALIAYLMLALGIPLPLPAGNTSGESFPCKGHPCGCATAEQCWRHCCCTTLAQRLAWARENHVTPPDYALAEARAHGIDWDTYCRVGPEHAARICHDGEELQTKCSQPTHSEQTCCHHAKDQPPRGIVWMQALACQGVHQNWMGLALCLPPPAVVCVFAPAAAEFAVLSPQYLASISLAPATPPPRSLHA